MSKRVCLLRSNPVKPDSRVEKEAIALTQAGYDVTIFAWDRDETYKLKRDFLEIGGMGIPIYRVGFKATFGDGMKNIIPYLRFQFAMRTYILNSNFDFIHACDFDTAFFTYRLSKRKKIKFVFDIFDFLCTSPTNLFQKIIKKAQYDIIKNSNATIICTEERKKQIQGSEPQKLIVIHNTPSSEQLNIDENIDEREMSDKIKVCYVGILQEGRLLKEIGKYFSNHPEIEFHIGGFGKLEEYFKTLSEQHDNIFFYGRIPYNETLRLECNCDIMLAIYDPSYGNHVYAAPNKFYESLFLGKPVIMARGTGMSSVVEQNEIGVTIEFSYEGFSNGINYLIDKRANWSDIGKREQLLYYEHYSWEEMNKRLLEMYNSI